MCSQGVILPPASRKVCVGVLADGFGTVARKEVQATWLYREGEEGPSMGPQASEGERLIIYFVGGGYVCVPICFLVRGHLHSSAI